MQLRPIIKKNRVVIILSGRYAGKKAVILKCYDQGIQSRKFGCALVVGVERTPRKVTKQMSKSKIFKRTRMKTFMKIVNYNHMMPTRYTYDTLSVDQKVDVTVLDDAANKKKLRTDIRDQFQTRYKICPEFFDNYTILDTEAEETFGFSKN